MKNYPRIGVGVCVVKDNLVLFGKRLSSHGQGTWQFPGGHLEFGESLAECAQPEVAEETGLIVGNIRLGPISEDLFEADTKHYITIFMIADYISGEPQALEPHKCSQWSWFAWDSWPEPLFLSFHNLIKNKIDLREYVLKQ